MFETFDLNSQIVTILKDYGTIPLEFLAKRLGRQTEELTDTILDLKHKDVLEIQGANVKLKNALKTYLR